MSDAATIKEIATEAEVTPRQTVFISHANPEDNEFAAWLGTRLIGAGYQVWSDLLRLVGGEPFWRDIGDAIKDHAAVVVLVLSRASVTKPGVLDEIALGDVLGLTKINFNACVFADGLPVTLKFADAVGDILTAAPVGDLPPLPFRHYI